jgi:hypothetical protein
MRHAPGFAVSFAQHQFITAAAGTELPKEPHALVSQYDVAPLSGQFASPLLPPSGRSCRKYQKIPYCARQDETENCYVIAAPTNFERYAVGIVSEAL